MPDVVFHCALLPGLPRPRTSGVMFSTLADDAVVECIDNFEKCLADQTGELSKHYNFNNILFLNEDEPVTLYLMWWVDNRGRRSKAWDDDDDDRHDGKSRRKLLTDVSMTTGVIDQFIVGDFINIGTTGPLSGNGRYVHGRCRDPRETGKVNIIIETNQ